MLTSVAAPRSPHLRISLLVAVSAATFVAGLTAGVNLPRASADGRVIGWNDGAKALTMSVGPTAASAVGRWLSPDVSGAFERAYLAKSSAKVGAHTAIDELSNAEWQALYGPTAASWGVEWSASQPELSRVAGALRPDRCGLGRLASRAVARAVTPEIHRGGYEAPMRLRMYAMLVVHARRKPSERARTT
jgi:hypothetical protein